MDYIREGKMIKFNTDRDVRMGKNGLEWRLLPYLPFWALIPKEFYKELGIVQLRRSKS